MARILLAAGVDPGAPVKVILRNCEGGQLKDLVFELYVCVCSQDRPSAVTYAIMGNHNDLARWLVDFAGCSPHETRLVCVRLMWRERKSECSCTRSLHATLMRCRSVAFVLSFFRVFLV